jgi:hypothetical protein
LIHESRVTIHAVSRSAFIGVHRRLLFLVVAAAALAGGAFTVGVLADDGDTRLELDLSAVPDAPADWRGR